MCAAVIERRPPHRCARWWIPVFIVGCLAQTGTALTVRSGSASFTTVTPRDTMFTLPVTWVILDSLHVFRNGEAQREFTEWRIAEPGNRIWIYRPLGPQDTLRVDYNYLPFPLLRTYLRRSIRDLIRAVPVAEEHDTLRIAPVGREAPETVEGWSRLNKSGSLIRSVQVGTDQDLQMESALNLQIQGRVGKNVDVIAALTDQSTPIQPEGTTESLNELEKIFVSVRTPHLSTTLGDYSLNLAGGQYDSYSRKLTGIMGTAAYAPVEVTASGAVSRGQFFTNFFFGQEANQGPYPLRGRNGESGLVVLAGTERVWLDGEPLRRGEGNDYVIDYAAGEIAFTARRVITADSRITVDFEYSNEDYERFYGAGRSAVDIGGGRASVVATWLTEADDRTRPITTMLSDADRMLLAAAGDRADSAVVFSGDSIGARGGDYVRIDTLFDGAIYSIFRFAPRDSVNQPTGQWRVFFDDFGAGRGDYEAAADSLGLTYFRWSGPARGRYRPYRRLPLAARHTLGDVRFQAAPAAGLEISAEAALSQRDENVFSARDDSDNDGAALALTGTFAREKLRLLGVQPQRIDARAHFRRRGAQFRELARSTEIEFDRAWDAGAGVNAAEAIRETELALSPIREITLRGGYGDLTRGDHFTSVRRMIGATVQPLPRWNAAANHLSLQSRDTLGGRRGDWIRQNGRIGGRVWRAAPRIGLDRERKRDRTRNGYSGFRFLEHSSGLGIDLPAGWSMDGEYRRRLDDYLTAANVYVKSATAYTATMQADWNPAAGGRHQARYVHREKDFAAPDSADIAADLGRLESLLLTQNRLLEANLVYELGKTRTQNRILVAVEVPAGTGNYRREGDQFVPDDQGNYLLVPRYTGFYEPATDLGFDGLLWLRPDELTESSLDAWVRALSAETELSIEEQTRHPLTLGLALLDQTRFRGDSTLTGRIALRQDIHIRRLSQTLAVRLRYRETSSLQNQYLNGGQARTLRESAVRVRAKYLPNWRGESEAALSRETLRYNAGTFPDRDIDRFDLSQGNTVVLSRRWEAGIDIAVTEAQDERTATQISLREVRPHAALIVFGRGRVDSDITWIHAASNKPAIPFELGRGANRGANQRWSLRGTYQFGQTFSGSLNYTGRRDAGEQTYHTGRMEVRASF